MRTIEPSDLIDIAAYEKVRESRLGEIIALKRRRRLALGPLVTLLFENRDTVISQIQEMMRAERIVHDDGIRGELAVYNELIPAEGGLSATLFIEVEDQSRVREVLDRFIGLDNGKSLFLRFEGGRVTPAVFESGHSREDRISAVHFVRFHLEEADRRALRSGEGKIDLVVSHPNYDASAPIDGDLRRELALDLA
jgi:hypothetical protein